MSIVLKNTQRRSSHLWNSRGFTLIEIMIVILIISIILMIAVPNIFEARSRSQTNVCRENLRSLAWAKEQWAMVHSKPQGAVVDKTDISPDYLHKYPSCPAGGTYDLKTIGESPTCSVSGHTYP